MIKEKEAALDKWKIVEREQLDAIDEETKQMEKLANKRSLLLKKVSLPSGRYVFLCPMNSIICRKRRVCVRSENWVHCRQTPLINTRVWLSVR